MGSGISCLPLSLLPPSPAAAMGCLRPCSRGISAASPQCHPSVPTEVAEHARVPWASSVFPSRISPAPGSPELLVRGIITCKSGSLMSLMKSSEGKRFSGELRIFISHTRNLTCRLVGAGNLSHEIVLLRAASSPAAFGNYLTHRLPLDRLPSTGMRLPAPKSAFVPLLMASTAAAGVQQLLKDSPPPLRSPDPLCWSLEQWNSVSDSGWLCPSSPLPSRAGTAEPPGATPASPGVGVPARGASDPSPSPSRSLSVRAHRDLGKIWGSFNPHSSLGSFGLSPGMQGHVWLHTQDPK